RARAVLCVGTPDDDEAAAGQRRDRGVVLRVAGRGVDDELAAVRDPGRGVALAVDAGARAVGAVLIRPNDNEAAVGVRRGLGLELIAGRARVHAELVHAVGENLRTGVVETLAVDVVADAARVVRRPRDEEAAVVGRDVRVALSVDRGRVDEEL